MGPNANDSTMMWGNYNGQLIDETATFMADFAFFAITFNVKKMAAKARKQGNMPTNGGLSEPHEGSYTLMG